MLKIKSEIEWVSCEEKLPECLDRYLVLIKQKYNYEEEYEYHTDIAMSFGKYIDGFWDTFIDWKEGQETHITHWAKLPSPLEIVEKVEK